MPAIQSVAAASAAAASFTYLINRVTGLSKDVSILRTQSVNSSNLKTHLTRLGNDPTLYRLLELADPAADALWFEGRTWSYAALKHGQ
jgi:hypothetical protein